MKKLVTLVATLVASVSVLAFSPTQASVDVKTEIQQRIAAGQSEASIARAALASGVADVTLAAAFQGMGKSADEANTIVAIAFAANQEATAAGGGQSGGGLSSFARSRSANFGATGGCKALSCS